MKWAASPAPWTKCGSLKEVTGERKIAERAIASRMPIWATKFATLNAIFWLCGPFKDPSLKSEERQKYLEIIERTGFNLAPQLSNDIWIFQKLKPASLKWKVCGLTPPTHPRSASLFSLRCEEKGIFLDFSPGKLAPNIMTWSHPLQTDIDDVIANAVKFTRQRGRDRALANSKFKNWFVPLKGHWHRVSPQSRDQTLSLFFTSRSFHSKEYGEHRVAPYFIKTLGRTPGGDVELKQSTLGKAVTIDGHNQLWKCAQYKPRA